VSDDFQALVDQVLAGKPAPLHEALCRLQARLRRPLAREDYPPPVLEMFQSFAPYAQPNGMPKLGRPLKDPDLERLRTAYRAWVAFTVRDTYREKLLWANIGKQFGREKIGDDFYPIDGEPSDLVYQEIGDQFGVGPDAIKKLLRKKKVPRA
jgi:hypothetical protein